MNNSNSILSNISSSSHASLWEEVAAILSGLIGGGLYGLKIRIPHSFGELCHILLAFILVKLFILIGLSHSNDVSIWESPVLSRKN